MRNVPSFPNHVLEHNPEILAALPRVQLANLPTPLHELPRLSEQLAGPRILIKRDDLTGLATGGNKTRKLEFLIADALQQNADCVITAGGPQSNHCRQTAAAAARHGLKCHLVLGGSPSTPIAGNLFIDQLLGAEIHWVEKPLRNQRMKQLAGDLRARGQRPYSIPIGGSNPLGAVGYVLAMLEIVAQLEAMNERVDQVFVATSSGGTQAGLIAGAALAGFAGNITGISIDQAPEDKFEAEIAKIATDTAQLLGQSLAFDENDVHLNCDYLGKGYGVVGLLERNTIYEFAQSEGILTGPVYTSRALGGMIDIVRRGQVPSDQTILFWHTGDEAALHGYVGELANQPNE